MHPIRGRRFCICLFFGRLGIPSGHGSDGVFLSLLLVLGNKGLCEEPSNTESKKAENLVTGVWRVPPGFIPASDSSEKNGTRKPLLGFQSKQNQGALQYDATEFLKASGVEFPPGSDAIYDQASRSLVVRNTQENLELVETLGGCPAGILPANVAVEISTFECRLPSQYSTPESRWPAFSDLTKSGSDLKLLDRVSAVTKSGLRAGMSHIVIPGPANSFPSLEVRQKAESAGLFSDGEMGTIADCETVVGPDGVTIDANLTYRFRRPTTGKSSSEISFKTSFTTMEGYPVVIHISPIPNQPDKFVLVIGKTRLANFGAWNFRETASGQKVSPSEDSGR